MIELTADDVAAVVADGPLTEDVIVDALSRRLGADADEVGDRLWSALDPARFVQLNDGRIAERASLVEGLTVWHRLDAEEIERHAVDLRVDGMFHLALGDHEGVRVDDEEADSAVGERLFLLPEAWGTDLAEGDVLGVVLDGDRVRLVRPGPGDLADAPGDVTALRAAIEEIGRIADLDSTVELIGEDGSADGWIIDLDEVAPDLLVAARDAVVGLRVPLGEALDATGLQRTGTLVGGDGVPPDRFVLHALGQEIVAVTRRWDDDEVDPEEVGLLWVALTAEPDEIPPELEAALLVLIRRAAAVNAVAAHLANVTNETVDQVDARVRAVLEPTDVGAAWLLARIALERGDAAAAYELLAGAADAHAPLDGDGWAEAWDELGVLIAIRGDVEGAQRTWRAAGERERAEMLGRWRPVVPTGVGRNDPCPCGSGRKFKQCCQRRPAALPLADRASFAWWKVQSWTMDRHRDCVAPIDFDLGMKAIELFLFSIQAHLAEGGTLDAVLAEVGALLPDDERALIETWRSARHRLWHVERADRDGSRRLRDVVTGDVVESGPDPATVPIANGTDVVALVLDTPSTPIVAGAVVSIPADQVEGVRTALADGLSEEEIYVLVRGAVVATAEG